MSKSTRTILIILGIIITIAIIAMLLLGCEKNYIVAFDSNGGSAVESQVVKTGQVVTRPSNPTKEGYEFVDWYYNNLVFDFNTKVNNNITLEAYWKAIIPKEEKYTVTFKNDNEVKKIEVLKGKKVAKPSEPTKDGYKFLGWYLNDIEFNFNTPITENITLIAKFVEEGTQIFEVTFNTDGGNSIASQTIVSGEKAKEPLLPTKLGYEFQGWYLNGTKYDFNTSVTENITLTAKWKNVGVVTITFNTDGGSNVTSQKITLGSKATKPSNPTKNGYTFVEWQLNGSAYDFSKAVTGNITLTAKWKENVVNYTVTFNSNGGSSVASQTIASGSKATKPSNPTKNGNTFVEWQLNGSAYDFSKAVTGNITLTAKWKENVVNYTVTFNSNGGSSVASQTIASGSKATKPSNPTKSGYAFVEWQLNGSAYDFSKAVTGNITLTAKWKENVVNYTVTFDSNGGSNVASQTIVSGSKASKPSNPTKSGYTFVEWQLNGSAYDFSKAVTGNITLTAKWTKNVVYTIKKAKVDDFSLDVRLSVYADRKQVEFKNIKYNGVTVCTSANPAVNADDIASITKFTVTLSDGSTVTATVE